MKFFTQIDCRIMKTAGDGSIHLYRGLEKELDAGYDMSKSDAPHGYSTWTDNPELARQYAGKEGRVYYVDLPESEMGKSAIDEDPKSETYGDRELFFFNGKAAALNGISGREVLVYEFHDLFDRDMIKEVRP
jgi:hypothetical protein